MTSPARNLPVRFAFALGAALTLSGAAPALDGDPEVRREFRALLAEAAKASEAYGPGIQALKTDEEKAAYLAANWPTEGVVAGRMLELARKHPGDPTAFDALAWLAVVAFNTPESDAAAGELARGHGADRRLWQLCQDMRRGPVTPGRAALLRAVIEQTSDRATRGRACLDLAAYQAELAGFVRLFGVPGVRPWHSRFYTEGRLDRFRALDPDRLVDEAKTLNRRVLDEFADVAPVKWHTLPEMHVGDPGAHVGAEKDAEVDAGTLADRAKPAIDELNRLDVGCVAPEIDGTDVNGRRLRLSDHRGKVVVLTFSGTWCGPCKMMYPHQREIVARLKGRPFAILSVMTDAEAEPVRKASASGEITWPCWWEREGPHGPIPASWNVSGYPTVYVLDAKGVIRLKFTGHLITPARSDKPQPPLDAFLDQLVAEAEAGAARPS